MKKIAMVAGFGAAALALAGCAEQAAEEDVAADTEAVAEEATAEEAPAEDPMAGETAEEAAPDVEAMDEGDRGDDTGRVAGE